MKKNTTIFAQYPNLPKTQLTWFSQFTFTTIVKHKSFLKLYP